MKKIIILLFLIGLSTLSFSQKYYTVEQIPNPKTAGQDYYVSNPDGILGNVNALNELATRIERETKVEIAIVAVKDFDEDKEDFEFAKALFDRWKIGKAGSNNGLLLFIATDRRKYRFITGSGVEGLLPDVVLKQAGDFILVPAFKEKRYDDGVLDVINSISDRLTNPENQAEIQSLIAQKTKKTFDWTFVLGGTLALILLFYFANKTVNKQAKASKEQIIKQPKTYSDNTTGNKETTEKQLKKTKKGSPNNTNGYDAVYTKGCMGIFFFLFISVFFLVFIGNFGLFKNFKLTYIPYILYVILAIGMLFRYYYYIADLRRTHFDDENFFEAVKEFHLKNWWLIIFSPFIVVALILHAVKKVKTVERFKPILDSQNNEMIRLDRDINTEGNPFLTAGQRKEEIIKTYDYDIWESVDHKEHIIKKWPAEEYNDFTECPSCGFRTYKVNKRETVKPATYSHEGQAKLINECSFCEHVEFIKWITLAMLVKSSSSSSSSSSGSSSSSSSSSGSFGGGSSSGGGAGGSW